MKLRMLLTLALCLSLVMLPLSGCSLFADDLTEPQEAVFTFLDQWVSGDTKLMKDALLLVDKGTTITEYQVLIDTLSKANVKLEGKYQTKTILIAENTNKPQTPSISSQYLRIPDAGFTVEIELHKVNDKWKLNPFSAEAIFRGLATSLGIPDSQTPNATNWKEGQIEVYDAFIQLWIKNQGLDK